MLYIQVYTVLLRTVQCIKHGAIRVRQVIEIKGETVSLKKERQIQAAAYT